MSDPLHIEISALACNVPQDSFRTTAILLRNSLGFLYKSLRPFTSLVEPANSPKELRFKKFEREMVCW